MRNAAERNSDRWSSAWRNRAVVGGLGLLVLLAAGCSKTGAAPTTTAAPATTAGSTTSPPSTAAPTTTTAPATTTTRPAAPVVLQTLSGSGIENGAQFTVPSGAKGWTLAWTYNCAAFGSSGNFVVNIQGYGSAANTTDLGVNELASRGSGTEHYYDTGAFQLQMNSECKWTTKVATIPG